VSSANRCQRKLLYRILSVLASIFFLFFENLLQKLPCTLHRRSVML